MFTLIMVGLLYFSYRSLKRLWGTMAVSPGGMIQGAMLARRVVGMMSGK